MPRKVFLSFLGTTNYKETKYQFPEQPEEAIRPTRFTQESILEQIAQNWTSDDAAYMFLTSQARKRNWEDCEYIENFTTGEKALKQGLCKSLEALDLPISIFDKDIEEGNSEEEIWSIFKIIFDCLQEGDTVYFDITHGFRSSPMLMLVLINYAKFLKGIEVGGIYYGAFEAKDKATDVAPIWDLISFSILQEYTAAANAFLDYGKTSQLIEVTKREIKPHLNYKSAKFEDAKKVDLFVKSLQKVSDSIQTNRGRAIVEGEIFQQFQNNLSASLDSDLFIAPIRPLLNKVQSKVATFNTEEDWQNGLKAVEWCIEHELVQQGITMLQETIYTYYCFTCSLDYKVKADREAARFALKFVERKWEHKKEEWDEGALELETTIEKIIPKVSKEIVNELSSLTNKARNDINHGGFSGSHPDPTISSEPQSPLVLKTKLKDSYNKISKLLTSPHAH